MRHLRLLAVLAASASAASAFALMPPHVTSIDPADGGTLTGKTVRIVGYSLEYTDLPKEFIIVDTATGKAVRFEHALSCQWVGECKDDKPGSCQQRCDLTVTLAATTPGQKLRLRYLDTEATFTVAPSSRAR